jgi:polar amino acid transport system substrate-binding protein
MVNKESGFRPESGIGICGHKVGVENRICR